MTDIRYLSVETVIAINKMVGGPGAGLADRAGLESALGRASSGFGDHETFPTLWEKAAAILHGLSTTQNFVDGNKRTAWVSAEAFLMLNGEPLMAEIDTDEAEAQVLAVAQSNVAVYDLARWLVSKAEPLIESLDDVGMCAMCGMEGPLPGAQLMPRRALRWHGLKVDEELLVYTTTLLGSRRVDAAAALAAHRDLVAGVCDRCRNGWMMLLDKRAFERLVQASYRQVGVLGVDVQRYVAAWVVRNALLRATFDEQVPREWILGQATALRRSLRTPPNWQVFLINRAWASLTSGNTRWRTTYNVGETAEQARQGKPKLFVYDQLIGYAAVVAVYIDPDDYQAEMEWSNSQNLQRMDASVRIWPRVGSCDWPPAAEDRDYPQLLDMWANGDADTIG